MSLISWLFGKKKPYNEIEILNFGLKLAMSFGKDWLKPIQPRLAKIYPDLTETELNIVNARCQEAMKFGHDTVYSMAEVKGKETNKEDFVRLFKGKYPWVNSANTNGVFSQGMYYAYKDLGF